MIVADELNKLYSTQGRTVAAMKDVNLSVEDGAFYVLLGPSGSGKTTTLRSVAGLERPDRGEIRIDDRIVFSSQAAVNVPPEQRPIAMVFQSYALWPHMDVANNITFPLRRGMRRLARPEIERRLERVLALLNLTEQKNRAISSLSGGQQQRVALARALALEPAVLLMDEPLSNLDAKLRARLRLELKQLTHSVGITTIYVTHDQTEAMMMGDRIAVMSEGTIQQEGTATELYQNPKNLFVARFLGDMNFLESKVEAVNGATVRLSTCAGPLLAKSPPAMPNQASVLLGFRPEDAELVSHPEDNVIQGRVVSRHYLGDAYLYDVACAAGTVQIRSPKCQRLGIADNIYLRLAPERCTIFGRDLTLDNGDPKSGDQ
jgi:ABC-type Fe3+/spermidine/putrescine transport system ATPase subunit